MEYCLPLWANKIPSLVAEAPEGMALKIIKLPHLDALEWGGLLCQCSPTSGLSIFFLLLPMLFQLSA